MQIRFTIDMAATAAYLKEYLAALPGSYLFTCRDGSIMTHSAYVKMWQLIVRKMNHAAGGTGAFPVISDLTAHIFRHNYCSNLCYQVPAISIKKIAQLMGDTEKRTRCGHWCQNTPCGRAADIKNHQLLLTFPYWENGIKRAGSLEFTGFPLFIS